MSQQNKLKIADSGRLGAAANHQSLEVEYTHLGKWPAWDFATYVQREPKTMLGIFHEVAQEVAKEQCPDLFLTSELMEIRMDIFVRITNCDVLSESIRDVRCKAVWL